MVKGSADSLFRTSVMILSLLLHSVCVARYAEGILGRPSRRATIKKKKNRERTFFLTREGPRGVYVGGCYVCMRRDRDKSIVSEMFPPVPIMSVYKKRPKMYPVNFEQLFIFDSEFHLELYFYFILLGGPHDFLQHQAPHFFKCRYCKSLVDFIFINYLY